MSIELEMKHVSAVGYTRPPLYSVWRIEKKGEPDDLVFPSDERLKDQWYYYVDTPGGLLVLERAEDYLLVAIPSGIIAVDREPYLRAIGAETCLMSAV